MSDLTGVLGKQARRARRGARRRSRSDGNRPRLTLSEAVRRVMQYLSFHPRQRVAVFVSSGRLMLASVAGTRYVFFLRCFPQSLVGIYDRNFDVDALLEDLRMVGGLR